jgi:16S rRNA (guanine(966)-N(2))-methyltransferase RsmD
VREALFDILGARVRGCHFLDAYAGTGAVGVEALSRGARHVVFIERDRRARELIEANLSLGPWQDSSEIIASDVTVAIPVLARCRTRFSVAFLDPPYDDREAAATIPSLGQLLLPGGLLVIEHRTGLGLAAPEAQLHPGRSYRYGDTTLTLLHRGPVRGRS